MKKYALLSFVCIGLISSTTSVSINRDEITPLKYEILTQLKELHSIPEYKVRPLKEYVQQKIEQNESVAKTYIELDYDTLK